jgi:hypothetical protein
MEKVLVVIGAASLAAFSGLLAGAGLFARWRASVPVATALSVALTAGISGSLPERVSRLAAGSPEMVTGLLSAVLLACGWILLSWGNDAAPGGWTLFLGASFILLLPLLLSLASSAVSGVTRGNLPVLALAALSCAISSYRWASRRERYRTDAVPLDAGKHLVQCSVILMTLSVAWRASRIGEVDFQPFVLPSKTYLAGILGVMLMVVVVGYVWGARRQS